MNKTTAKRINRLRGALCAPIVLLIGTAGCDDAKPAPEKSAPTGGVAKPALDPKMQNPTNDGATAKRDGSNADTKSTQTALSGDAPASPRLERTTTETPVTAKVVKNPGFKLEPLLKLYALAATPAQTAYGAPVDDATKSRDDDLNSAATCTPSADKPCALGLRFPEPAKISMIRAFFAGGPNYRDYKGSPRPKEIVVHTDAGKTTLTLKDGATHKYIKFETPVETQTLSIEVAAVHKGGKTQTLRFAELEVYGTEGEARAPIELFPARSFTYFETAPWKDRGDGTSTVKMTWTASFGYTGVGTPAGTQRLQRGGALFGKHGDRFMLVEKLLASTCDAPDVSYVLIDQTTRMIFPLGKLAEGGATIHRHTGGMGFMAVPRAQDGAVDTAGIRMIAFDPENKSFTRKRGKQAWTVAEHTREWSFDQAPLPRGGPSLDAWVRSQGNLCSTPDATTLESVYGKTKLFSSEDPGTWVSCNVGDGHHMMIGRDAVCGEKVAILLEPPGEEASVLAEYIQRGQRPAAPERRQKPELPRRGHRGRQRLGCEQRPGPRQHRLPRGGNHPRGVTERATSRGVRRVLDALRAVGRLLQAFYIARAK
ncbi:MAG: hypothetical protein ACPG4T_06815 [Nannocystaceae bacterium]